MVVKQVALDFPPEIWEAIAKGILFVNGSVVRDAAGLIVTHIPEIKLPAKSSSFDLTKVIDGLKTPKGILIGLGVVAAAVVVSVVVSNRKSKASAEPGLPKSIDNYTLSLGNYLVAINSGHLTPESIDLLVAHLGALKGDIANGIVSVDFSASQAASLLLVVRDYTLKFAEANSFQCELPVPHPTSANDSIELLLNYLSIQAAILSKPE